MELSEFISAYPQFLNLLKERGYSKSTIEKYEWICNRLKTDVSILCVNNLEDYYLHLCGKLSPKTLPEIKSRLGAIDYYMRTGDFIFDTHRKSNFLRDSSYTHLNDYYKSLVDLAVHKLAIRYSKSTVRSIWSAASVFCLNFQNSGYLTFSDIKTQDAVLAYFHDGNQSVRSSAHRYYVSAFLSACSASDSHCCKILSFLPTVPERRKNYDYLKPAECRSIEYILSSDKLSLRDKAIGTVAYYTGLRSSDIVNLSLGSVNLDNSSIIIKEQIKTEEPLVLPLRPVVRDCICEYVAKGRPVTLDSHLFVTSIPPYRGMDSGSMDNISRTIMNAAGIRKESGRRGLHLFRHAFASDLISKDVPRHHVSALLGHTSLSSVDRYIDADIEHLRSCALSIEPYAPSKRNIGIMYKYQSASSDTLESITEKLKSEGMLDPHTHWAICMLDNFCVTTFPGKDLNQDILDKWCYPQKDELRKRYDIRMKACLKINRILSEYGLRITKKEYPPIRNRTSFAEGFISCCKPLFDDFIAYRKASSRWSLSYDYAIKAFDVYCHEHIPTLEIPSQEVIDTWSVPKGTERLSSCGKRTAFISSLCRFILERTGQRLTPPQVPTNDGIRHIPHNFKAQELDNLFVALDSIPRIHKSKATLLRTLAAPALFRLMYSAGLRTKEARLLSCGDVDLSLGVINIAKSKGWREHRVALHPSMTAYLIGYDNKMKLLVPDRKYFFANVSGNYYSQSWVENNFELAWYTFNGGHAVPYDLRHHYATENINRLPSENGIFNKELVYLSRSMGHSGIDETMYYYCQSPEQAQSLIKTKSDTFRDVIGCETSKLHKI